MPFQEDLLDDVHPLREVVKTSEEARPAQRQRCFIFSLLQSLAGTSLLLTRVSLSAVKSPLARCSLRGMVPVWFVPTINELCLPYLWNKHNTTNNFWKQEFPPSNCSNMVSNNIPQLKKKKEKQPTLKPLVNFSCMKFWSYSSSLLVIEL